MKPHPSQVSMRHTSSFVVVMFTLALAACLLLVGCATTDSGSSADGRPVAPSSDYTLSAAGDPTFADPVDTTDMTATSGAPDREAAEQSLPTDRGVPPAEFPTGIVPTRIRIPAIDVDARVVDLDLRGAEPEVPENFGDTGWYSQTRLPGEIGPSVIAGHVDSVDGPAVFARLSLLEPGDEIIVADSDGEERSFVVVDTGQYPKTNLPDEVFGFGRPVPELRLITCGGTFDRSIRHYVDNFVVYAVSSSQSPSAL